MDATREALFGGVARTNRQPARVRSGRQGGGEARSTEEAGQCRQREGASVREQRKMEDGT